MTSWHLGGAPSRVLSLLFLSLLATLLACTNDPYPDEDRSKKILYTPFREAPRTLDPAVAYTTSAHAITGAVYDTLLEYHYLKRPYELIPGLAVSLPEITPTQQGITTYRFELRAGVLFQDDPSFALGGEGRTTREVSMADVAFQLMRLADPAVNCPVRRQPGDCGWYARFEFPTGHNWT